MMRMCSRPRATCRDIIEMMAEAAHFDDGMNAWVLSRYEDVLAALREPTLAQTGAAGPIDEATQLRARTEVLEALAGTRAEEWRGRVVSSLRDALDRLPIGQPVDLATDFLQPWASALTATEPHAGKSLFTGVSETLPNFLANALLDLVHNPDRLADLRGSSDSSSRAVEELLRHAGLVHMLVRTATADIDIGGVRIECGQRVVLKLAAANRDANRFEEPERLDPNRRANAHVALGAGAHSCAGAVLVRLATLAVICEFAARFTRAELCGPVEWHEGSTLRYPTLLPVIVWR